MTDRSLGYLGLFASLVRNRRWWAGALLLVASLALQAAALSRGSVLLVQALLTLSVLFALPINAKLSNRAVTAGEWIWASLLTAGVIVVVTVGNPQAGRPSASLQTWAIVAAVLGPLLAACIVLGRIKGNAVAATLFAFVSGSLWGVFAILTKEVMARLGMGGWTVIHTPELYACALVAAGAVVWSQSAFRAGPLTASMPALQMSQPVVAALLGVVVLDETLSASRAGIVALATAVLVMAVAIFQLARVDAFTMRDRVAEQLRDEVSAPL